MARSFTYTFDANDVITLTTADGLSFVQGGSQSYEGYGVLSVSGLVRGRTILGLSGSGSTAGTSTSLGLYDNVVVPYGMMAPGSERYGIDGQGVAFTVAQTDPSQPSSYKLSFVGDSLGVALTADGAMPVAAFNSNDSGIPFFLSADPGGSEVFVVDGSQGAQSFTGHATTNYIVTSSAAGTGDVVVDFRGFGGGTVTKGGQIDATTANVTGAILGSDSTVIYGGGPFNTVVPNLVFGSSGHLEFHAAAQRVNSIIQGSTESSYIVGGVNSNGVGSVLFYGHGATDVMVAGNGTNTMVCNANPDSTSLFAGLQAAPVFDAGSSETDYIYARGGTVTVFGGVFDQILFGSSGTNTLVGTQKSYEEGNGQIIETGTNVLYGGTGPDAGTDIFYAAIGVNILYEGSGTDTFVGSAGADHIVGGSGRSFVYGGTGTQTIDTGAGNQYVSAGSGNTVLNETAAFLTEGRSDWIDNFKVAAAPGGAGTYINLPKAAAAGTLFQAVNGGTLILAPATNTGAAAGLFVSNTAVGDVQHQTFFTT